MVACKALGLTRSLLCYRPADRDDSAMIGAMQAYVHRNARHGFGLLNDAFKLQGQPWRKTVLWRLYCQLNLNLPHRGKKRLPERLRESLSLPQTADNTWSADFIADAYVPS